ncbi:unnamed protein product [Polarella glacialis]|uniref:F-box domain-containing protein n=1 Tax=Polarella glacialis TaxID=89957 RepID=A0A813JWX3_POLGL|nr:unnamed protein product [Polarella glacialis]
MASNRRPELHHDALMAFFLHLPSRELAIASSVCPRWRSLIDASLDLCRRLLAGCRVRKEAFRAERVFPRVECCHVERHTLALKARSELRSNCDFARGLAVLQSSSVSPFVQHYELYAPGGLYCSQMLVQFSTHGKDAVAKLYAAVSNFLTGLDEVEDGHRICETMNFSDEFTGEQFWDGPPAAERILARLPEKIRILPADPRDADGYDSSDEDTDPDVDLVELDEAPAAAQTGSEV